MTTEFDRVFDQMKAPEYPATCDNCGEVGTNATMEQHECAEQPAQRERSKGMTTGLPPRTDHEFVPLPPPNEHLLACARCFRPRAAHEQPRPEQGSETTITKQSDLFPRYTFAVVTGRYKILDNRSDSEPRVQQIATADGEDEARLIVNALNAIAHHDAPSSTGAGQALDICKHDRRPTRSKIYH